MRTLVAGWFSFEQMGATAGDLMVRDLVSEWLEGIGVSFDIAIAPPFTGGVDWSTIAPEDYDQVVFVCGPFGNGPPITEFLPRFAHCRLIGLDLSMLQPLDEWNPFDLLIERDSSEAANPDITFLARGPKVPVVGVVQVHPQTEYGDRALHAVANDAIDLLLAPRDLARIQIDTCLDINATGLRTPSEVESLIARMDAVVTTRLHGAVLAIKNGVPALAIDPIAGGAKISTQMKTIGWPLCFTADSLDDGELTEALDRCLTPEARDMARRCASSAVEVVTGLRDQLLSDLKGLP